MSDPILSAGDSIEARCTKCRKNLTHTLVSLTDENPDKVECRTCKRQHKYRPPIPVVSAAARQVELLKNGERKEWQSLRPGMDSSKAVPYSMTTSFKVKTLINHPTFGLGLVRRVAGVQKVEVLFEDGCKIMRCK